jgi:hypothetical protein
MIASGQDWELRLGRWQDELADVEVDALIFDAPYSALTHDSKAARNDGVDASGLRPSYAGLTEADIREFCETWSERCRGWMVSITDSVLAPIWREHMERSGRLTFQPVPCVMRGMSVRMTGDGPSSWAVYAQVGRPRNEKFVRWGTLDGAYHGPRGSEAGGGRGKPDWLMSALVRDYSRPGDLICDPFTGWGSTLSAAVANNRRAIGSEMDRDAFNEAARRLNRPLQVDMFGGAA